MWRTSSLAAFCAGLVAGGVLSAMLFAVIGALLRIPFPPMVAGALLGVAFVVAALRELGVLSFRLPQNRRLVPETVFRHGPVLGPLQFGLEMGSGMRTYVTSGPPYVAIVAVLLLAGPLTAAAAGIGFGLGRSLMTVSNLRYGPSGEWDAAWVVHSRIIAGALVAALGALCVVVAW